MNINTQSAFFPPQPDNPTPADRERLALYALTGNGRPEDLPFIKSILSPPEDITAVADPSDCKSKTVGIIGGGLAGLSAAFELRKLGFDITVIEAVDDRVGGRVYTYYFDREKKLYGEFGPMRIPVTHETVWHYLELFRLPTKPFIQVNPHAFIYLKNIRVRNDPNGLGVMNSIYPFYDLSGWERKTSWQRLLSIGMNGPLLNATAEERAEIIQVKPSYSQKTLFWNEKNTMQIFEQAGLSQAAISLIVNFSALLYGNLYNSYIDLVQEDYPVSLSYLYEIPGGMQRLPNAFYRSLMNPNPPEYTGLPVQNIRKVNWIPGNSVTDIFYDSLHKKVQLRYRSTKTKVQKSREFDYVVCAIPFSTLRNVTVDPLFSDLKARAIREVNYCTAQKTLLLCNQRFWQKQGIIGGSSVTDLPLSQPWYPSDDSPYLSDNRNTPEYFHTYPYNKAGVLLGSYNFNLDATRLSNLPEDVQLIQMKRMLERVHGLDPGALDSVVRGMKRLNWDEQPTFRGSLCFFNEDQKRLFSYAMALPEYEERIFFAGEHISAVHRWMQGALQTGMQAANDLAFACRRHGNPPR